MAVSSLLHNAELLAKKEEVLKSDKLRRGELYNVFRSSCVDHHETTHSAILAEWLNPKVSHGQGDLFLRLFLAIVDANFAQIFHSSKASTKTEYSTPNGRLDILIEDNVGNAVIIENKNYANDQDAQLKRYAEFAKSTYGIYNYRFLYLTLDGCEASKQSGEGVRYSPISYRSTILEWIAVCKKELVDKPVLLNPITQYESFIKQLTGQDMDNHTQEVVVEEMIREPYGAAAIIKSQERWEKVLLEKSLFDPLKVFAATRNLKFTVNERFWHKAAWGRLEFEIEPHLLIVFECEHQGRNSFYYGITDLREKRPERKLLPGLEGGNDDWRYGWHYLEKHKDWTIDDIVAISQDNGEFLKYICNVVDKLLEGMRKEKII